ncbi:MAG: N-acetyltransferase family protein [Sphingobacteriales bacterium]|nr:MAG: N-acetyltransferase family protein [Sphingobacteriales bacterium]
MLRHAFLADLPRIVEIYNQTIPGRLVTADLEPVTVESRVSWFQSHNPEKRPLWVWEVDGNITAWMSFRDFYGRPAYRHTAEISIYIHEDFRSQGLGKQLLAYALEQCPKLEIKTLLGFIFGHNIPSIKLFQNFGFEEYAHLPEVALLDDDWRDLIILGKKI